MNTLSIIHTRNLFPFQLVFDSVPLFILSIMGRNSSGRLAVAAFTPPKSGESGVVPKAKCEWLSTPAAFGKLWIATRNDTNVEAALAI